MSWESVTIHRHPGNPHPLHLNIPAYTSWYWTSHIRVLAHSIMLSLPCLAGYAGYVAHFTTSPRCIFTMSIP
jgi:hypothetical protein